MSELGILQTFGGTRVIYLYDSEEEREETWNGLTPTGRKRYNWQKVEVEVKLQEGEQ